ncbi:patatin-like phospholipase family protein [Limobrevibacterium gyesilva]|uniref:Patatin-like phospholipase family protein n=1 Tax=Limobrevibacterium gyesilva TaxID=2991712 RepID=A0AA41YJV3_9PROT|nr:patatin-like phospholipase family protein [Limobrevibacterium gyesilva]MCW3473452.1 patatin-like phospholipase family protein [Limobrevibacterium gyesilva]
MANTRRTRHSRNRSDHGGKTGGKTINLALQGGGAHGAFTWGVLDRLLQDDRIAVEGISATSAGAMNAAVFAHGLAVGGREGARAALGTFWRRVSEVASFGPFQASFLDWWLGDGAPGLSPALVMFDFLTRVMSPYEFNPWNWNPLRAVLNESIAFDRLREDAGATRLFLCATNVRTGKLKIFGNREITVDAVLASACIPVLSQAVEVDGEAYWDGGYMGNPAIFPLIYECRSRDVLIVHINPLVRPEVPRSAPEIIDRMNEISFNSSLMREMRAITFVSKLIDDGEIREGLLPRIRMHSIFADDVVGKLGAASKRNARWPFLVQLCDAGRAAADAWLGANYDQLGRASTVDIAATFL